MFNFQFFYGMLLPPSLGPISSLIGLLDPENEGITIVLNVGKICPLPLPNISKYSTFYQDRCVSLKSSTMYLFSFYFMMTLLFRDEAFCRYSYLLFLSISSIAYCRNCYRN